MSQGPDLLLGTRFSVGVKCSALLADTQADHMSLHGHKPLTTAMDLDWSCPWGCPWMERWELVMSVFLFCFFCWPDNAACRILVPQLRIESIPSAVKMQSPNQRVPSISFLESGRWPRSLMLGSERQPSMGQALMKSPNISPSLTSGSPVTMAHITETSGGREN